MLKIRLARFGRQKQPRFKIVVCEDAKPLKGKFLQILGYFNPQTGDISFDKEKILNFLEKGAQPSNAVSKILKKEGLKHKAIVVKVFKAKSKAEIEAERKKEEEERAKKKAEMEKTKQEWEEKAVEMAEEAKESASAEATADKEKEEVQKAEEKTEEYVEGEEKKTEKASEEKTKDKDIPSSKGRPAGLK